MEVFINICTEGTRDIRRHDNRIFLGKIPTFPVLWELSLSYDHRASCVTHIDAVPAGILESFQECVSLRRLDFATFNGGTKPNTLSA